MTTQGKWAIHTFQRQANVTQDIIMKNTVEQKEDKKETERNNNFFLPDPIKGGILVLAHWSVSDDPSLQHLSPITPLLSTITSLIGLTGSEQRFAYSVAIGD